MKLKTVVQSVLNLKYLKELHSMNFYILVLSIVVSIVAIMSLISIIYTKQYIMDNKKMETKLAVTYSLISIVLLWTFIIWFINR